MEGQHGVTKGMRVEGWTGPKGSRDLTRLLLPRTHLLLRMPRAVTGPQRERARQGSQCMRRSPTCENTCGSIKCFQRPTAWQVGPIRGNILSERRHKLVV